MEKCYFCDYTNKGNLPDMIAENKHAIAIFDDWLREGHCTIFLKDHRESISQINKHEYGSICDLISLVSQALEKKYDCKKTYLLSICDQTEHIHFHLIPKHKDKCSMGVYCFEKLWEVEGVRKTSKTKINKIAKEIKEIIATL